jgi:hypothetical protein
MTTPEPRTRRCPSCGYRFRVSGDEVYCSAICAGSVSAGTVLLAAQQIARAAGRG